jgi:glutathione S-transferase
MIVHTHQHITHHHQVKLTYAEHNKENVKPAKPSPAGPSCDKKRKRDNSNRVALPLRDVTELYLLMQHQNMEVSWEMTKSLQPELKRVCHHVHTPVETELVFNYESQISDDLLQFYSAKEKEHRERKFKHINPKLPREYMERFRFTCAEWLTEVAAEMTGIRQYLVHLATSFMDRFIAQFPEFQKTKLQLLAATCFVIAAKRDSMDGFEPTFRDMAYYCDNQFTVADFVLVESLVLNALQWELSEVTTFQFLDSYIDHIATGDPSSRMIASKCTLFADLWLKEKLVMDAFLPSTVAAAALYTTCLITGRGMDAQELLSITGKSLDDIRDCCNVFNRVHREDAQAMS